MPRYLYLKDPGSRWQLADDVDIAELRAGLVDVRFGTVHTEVIVDGLRCRLAIPHDQVHPHAIVDAAGTRPARSASCRMMSLFSRADEMMFPDNATFCGTNALT